MASRCCRRPVPGRCCHTVVGGILGGGRGGRVGPVAVSARARRPGSRGPRRASAARPVGDEQAGSSVNGRVARLGGGELPQGEAWSRRGCVAPVTYLGGDDAWDGRWLVLHVAVPQEQRATSETPVRRPHLASAWATPLHASGSLHTRSASESRPAHLRARPRRHRAVVRRATSGVGICQGGRDRAWVLQPGGPRDTLHRRFMAGESTAPEHRRRRPAAALPGPAQPPATVHATRAPLPVGLLPILGRRGTPAKPSARCGVAGAPGRTRGSGMTWSGSAPA